MVYLAVNLGAKRCTLVKGRLLPGGRVSTELVHSFRNTKTVKDDGMVVLDAERVFAEIVLGLKKSGKVDYISVDSDGYDFILLDDGGNAVSECGSYPGDGSESKPDGENLFRKTGLKKAGDYLVYQLLKLKDLHPDILEKAAFLFSLSDYISYRLTGIMKHEYTFASVSGLLDPATRSWNHEMIDSLGLPVHLFTALSDPGSEVGTVSDEIASRIGCSPVVVLSHSYAPSSSAFATPEEERTLFLLAGDSFTLGYVDTSFKMDEEAMYSDISNEGDSDGSVRVTSSFSGLSLLRNLANESGVSLEELRFSAKESRLRGTFSTSESAFSTLSSIEEGIGVSGLSVGEAAAVLYHSIALTVRSILSDLKRISGREFAEIFVVGDGSQDPYLLDLIAMYAKLPVSSGAAEPAALGNIINQMVASGEIQPSMHGNTVRKASFITRYRRIE